MKLAVYGNTNLPQASAEKFTHMISIGDSGSDLSVYRLRSISAPSHLCLNFRDRKSRGREDAPKSGDIRPLIPWLDSAGEINGLLVHCGAGMSRSPAIALLASCYLQPQQSVFELMKSVAASCFANYIWPNPLVIELGDEIMNRNGEIIAGVNQWRRTIEPDFTG